MVDDERQRYTAWFRDSNPTEPSETRSQQLRTLSAPVATTTTTTQQPPTMPNVVDLQISLIIPTTITKPMQVRLTKRQQCSDLRGYLAGQQAGGGAFGVSSAISQLQAYSEQSAIGSSASRRFLPKPTSFLQVVTLLTTITTILTMLLKQTRTIQLLL